MFRTGLFGDVLISDATKDASRLLGERARTEISLRSAAIGTANGICTLTVTGDNIGATSIDDFSRMDLIVQFSEGVNVPQRFAYTTGASPVSTGDWVKDLNLASNPDLYEPGILNPGEAIKATAKLDLPSAGDTSGTVTLGTPNGVIDTLSFGLVTPCP